MAAGLSLISGIGSGQLFVSGYNIACYIVLGAALIFAATSLRQLLPGRGSLRALGAASPIRQLLPNRGPR
jgi:hypothetical protein